MAFTKTTSYFKRFQVKLRRRRDGKTDYYARKRLVQQDKNKYNTPKYRLVVRITNKDVICQIVYSRLQGDFVMCAAYSHELPRFGVKVGLTNYAAAYCTGLLCARRLLEKLGLAKKFEGKLKADGEMFSIEDDEGRRPFKAFLDVGLHRTTTGARVFAAMKGAVDGGINVPHNEKRLAGFSEGKLDSEVLRKYIYGGHVADYMKTLKESDPERYKKNFSKFIKAGIEGEDLEKLYLKAHELIRANPSVVHERRIGSDPSKKAVKKTKSTLAERKARVAEKIAQFEQQAMDE